MGPDLDIALVEPDTLDTLDILDTVDLTTTITITTVEEVVTQVVASLASASSSAALPAQFASWPALEHARMLVTVLTVEVIPRVA